MRKSIDVSTIEQQMENTENIKKAFLDQLGGEGEIKRQTSASNSGSVNSGGKWTESSWCYYDDKNCAEYAAADAD